MNTPQTNVPVLSYGTDSSDDDSSLDTDSSDDEQPQQFRVPPPRVPVPAAAASDSLLPGEVPSLPAYQPGSQDRPMTASDEAPAAVAATLVAIAGEHIDEPGSAPVVASAADAADGDESEEAGGVRRSYTGRLSSAASAAASAAAADPSSSSAVASARKPRQQMDGACGRESKPAVPRGGDGTASGVQHVFMRPVDPADNQDQANASTSRVRSKPSSARHVGIRLQAKMSQNSGIMPLHRGATFNFMGKRWKVKSPINDTMVVAKTLSAQPAVDWTFMKRVIPDSLKPIYNMVRERCAELSSRGELTDEEKSDWMESEKAILIKNFGDAAFTRCQTMLRIPPCRPDFVAVQVYPRPPDNFDLEKYTLSFVMLENEQDILEVSMNGTQKIFKEFGPDKSWKDVATQHISDNWIVRKVGEEETITVHVPIRAFLNHKEKLSTRQVLIPATDNEEDELAGAAPEDVSAVAVASSASAAAASAVPHESRKRPNHLITYKPVRDRESSEPHSAAYAAVAAAAGDSVVPAAKRARQTSSSSFDSSAMTSSAKSMFQPGSDNLKEVMKEATTYVNTEVMEILTDQAKANGTSLVIEFKRWVHMYDCLNKQHGVPRLVVSLTTPGTDDPSLHRKFEFTQAQICHVLWRFFLFTTAAGRGWLENKALELQKAEITSKKSMFV